MKLCGVVSSTVQREAGSSFSALAAGEGTEHVLN